MDPNDNSTEKQRLNHVSAEAKNFFSAGATFSTMACASAVHFTWIAIENISPVFGDPWCGLVLSGLIVLAYAVVLPEPSGYPNAGKMRLTLAESIFGFFNACLIYGMVLGFRSGIAP